MAQVKHSPMHEAVLWAAQLHAGQDRDGDPAVPYLTHPLEVMNNLRMAGVKDEAILIAAILHDTVEESEVGFDEISKRFGEDVRGLVQEMTRHEPTEAETAGMTPDEKYALRSQMLLDEIKKMSPRAQAIKLADRLSNLRESIVTRKGKKKVRYLAQTQEMLKIIPPEVNRELWKQLNDLTASQIQ